MYKKKPITELHILRSVQNGIQTKYRKSKHVPLIDKRAT